MSNVKTAVANTWEQFAKYVGVQGLMGLVLVCGYVFGSLQSITLPDNYLSIMTLVIGYYFAKNGVGIIAALTGAKK